MDRKVLISRLLQQAQQVLRNILPASCRGLWCLRSSSTNAAFEKPRWSYTHRVPQAPLLGVTIGQLLQSRVEQHPERDAVVFYDDGCRLSFQQLLTEADSLAAGLIDLGLKKGDRVGMWGPNSREWVITQYATARAGFILVNINPLYKKNELEYALKKVGCKALVAAPSFKDNNYYQTLSELLPELATQSSGSINSQMLPNLKVLIMLEKEKFPGTFQFEDILKAASPNEVRAVSDVQNTIQFDEPINIQFTSLCTLRVTKACTMQGRFLRVEPFKIPFATWMVPHRTSEENYKYEKFRTTAQGTTGFPKGATLSHHNIVNNCYNVGLVMNYHNKETRICCPVPLYHCFGMVMGSMQLVCHGAAVVFPSKAFDAQLALRAVQEERCTSLYGVPTMFIDMLSHDSLPTVDLSTLYTGIMAGSPCPIEVMRRVITEMHMSEITVCYGSTETSPVTFQSRRDSSLDQRVSTVGCVSDHVEAKVVDEAGKIVPVGVTGELCTRGYTTMLGYWADSEKTAECIKEDRWFHTGDQAVMSEDGYCCIVGRLKDMIIRGGENIYPTEIEQILYLHPKVKDVQVIGVPDERLGEEVCAWIQLKAGETEVSEEELRNFCREKMARFKVPRYFRVVEEFPMTVTGKVQKFKMREQSTKDLGL